MKCGLEFENMNKQVISIGIFIYVVFPQWVIGNAELPDPTRPATYFADESEPVFFEEIVSKESINWKLSAIRISEKDKTAIVNGKLVRVGDDVGPAKIVEIKPLSVVIDHEDRKLIVRLLKNKVIKDYN
jgi:hypothetical protein